MSLDFEIILEEKVENDSTKLISEIADNQPRMQDYGKK